MGKTRNTGFSNNAIQYNSGSIAFVSGSNTLMNINATGSVRYGLVSSNTHQITGSVSMTGSLAVVTTGTELQVNANGVNLGNALTDVHVISGSLRVNPNGLFVSSSGNVGIGTTSPNYSLANRTVLDINGTNESLLSFSNGGTARGYIYSTSGGQTYWTEGSRNMEFGIAGVGYMGFGTNNTERMRITSTGQVGIGTTSTSTEANLFLGAQGASEGGQLVLQKATSYASASHIDNYQDQLRIMSGTDVGSSTVRMIVNMATGNVAIAGAAGSGRLQVWGEDQSGSNFSLTTYNSGGFGMFFVRNDGNIRTNSGMYGNTTSGTTRSVFVGNGDFYLGGISSTRASKKNIENISNIDWIYQLNPVTFNYRKKDEEGNYIEETYEELNYGLIAEDTAPIADFLINYNDREDGSKEMIGIEYMRLITPMLKAIQELKAENDALKTRIETLENK